VRIAYSPVCIISTVLERRKMTGDHPKMDIGIYETDVKATLARFNNIDIVRRIRKKDYTVWKPK
jgi:hypothetical protein